MKIIDGTISAPKGFSADGKHCGLKRKKKDIGLIYSKFPAQVAAVFTTNKIQAAPITVTKQAVKSGTLQAIAINSGNANACTGKIGLENAYAMQKKVAEKLKLPKEEVAIASTGIIGQLLPMPTVEKGIELLDIENGDSVSFHEAILTTDTGTKEIVVEAIINGKTVTMAGVAKGSGMIHPNMATMLSFITTDATISNQLLQELLKEQTEITFNQITIDGDTSTNDMVIVMANGASKIAPIEKNTESYQLFCEMFHFVSTTLAKMIAQDGEGATKLVEVEVINAKDALSARMAAKKVVGSSLVKTAIFGEDPNWGRIICAVGYSKIEMNPETIDIFLGNCQVLKDSQPQNFNQEKMKAILQQKKIKIVVDLKIGEATGMAWGCDLTYKYVEINALYHT